MPNTYSSIPGYRNWQIETAVWNLAGFLHCALETHWQRFGQFLNDLLDDFLDDFHNDFLDDLLHENSNFLCKKHRFSL